MDFATAYSTFSPGDYVAVSDGKPEPSRRGGIPWRHWRSHNFIGRLVEKASGKSRCMKFEIAPAGGTQVEYAICEGVGHTFEPSDAASFNDDAIVLM